MSKYHEYKKVPVDGVALYNELKSHGYSISSISREIGIGESTLSDSIKTNKINPEILKAIGEHIKIDMHEICPEMDTYHRTSNGRGTKSGRMRIDWQYLENVAKEEGYTLGALSEELGHDKSYLHTARVVGGLSADVITRLADILSVDPITLTDYTEPGAANIVNLIDKQPY